MLSNILWEDLHHSEVLGTKVYCSVGEKMAIVNEGEILIFENWFDFVNYINREIKRIFYEPSQYDHLIGLFSNDILESKNSLFESLGFPDLKEAFDVGTLITVENLIRRYCRETDSEGFVRIARFQYSKAYASLTFLFGEVFRVRMKTGEWGVDCEKSVVSNRMFSIWKPYINLFEDIKIYPHIFIDRFLYKGDLDLNDGYDSLLSDSIYEAAHQALTSFQVKKKLNRFMIVAAEIYFGFRTVDDLLAIQIPGGWQKGLQELRSYFPESIMFEEKKGVFKIVNKTLFENQLFAYAKEVFGN